MPPPRPEGGMRLASREAAVIGPPHRRTTVFSAKAANSKPKPSQRDGGEEGFSRLPRQNITG